MLILPRARDSCLTLRSVRTNPSVGTSYQAPDRPSDPARVMQSKGGLRGPQPGGPGDTWRLDGVLDGARTEKVIRQNEIQIWCGIKVLPAWDAVWPWSVPRGKLCTA